MAGKKGNPTEQASKLKGLLEKCRKEELVELLLRLASEEEALAERLELQLSGGAQEGELKSCRKVIRSSIRRHSERGGFVPYREVYGALEGARTVLEQACKQEEAGKVISAVTLRLCVLDEATRMLQLADDSDGFIGDIIHGTLAELKNTADQSSRFPDAVRGQLFEALAAEVVNPGYDDWSETRHELLRMCTAVMEQPGQRVQLEVLLDRYTPKTAAAGNWSSEYDAEQMAVLRYELIHKMDGEDAARAFLQEHLQYTWFREEAVDLALREGQHDQALELTAEGEQQAADQRLPGLVDQWRKRRCDIYGQTGQLQPQRELMLEFVLGGDTEYYERLKMTYEPAEWTSVYPEILNRLDVGSWRSQLTYKHIVLEERETERLLRYVEQYPAEIEVLYPHLWAEYEEEVIRLFRQHIEQKAEEAGNRKQYYNVARSIKLLKKAGGAAAAKELTQTLMERYPRRAAMKDELAKI